MANKIRFIGDIHGLVYQYLNVIQGSDLPTVQIGDFGYGPKWLTANPIPFEEKDKHRFIRGNHDDPAICKQQYNYIQDGTVKDNIGFIGGASSIDRAFRTEGVSWWPDEECSYAELNHALDNFIAAKPEVIVSHECPEFISNALCESYGKRKYPDESRTRQMLEQIYYHYKPKIHIFGHWHLDFDWICQGTRFICLPELAYIDIDMDDLGEHSADSVVKSYYDRREYE